MLASRQLPPPLHRPPPPPPPVATFYNVPRRYIKSSMQVSHEKVEDVKSGRHLRKSSRIHEPRVVTASSPTARRIKELYEPLPTPTSPQTARKRATSLNGDANGEDNSPVKPKTSPSASPTGSTELLGHVCLCQPEPKIPRPRNAFILYRQHHQHAIVARNPGLANPDISKIIGEQWKAESESQKKVWQDLAQEEKARHQEQYPEYRYQPRRLGKPGSLPSNPSGQHTIIDKYRCPRCGGRSIKTSTSPFFSSTSSTPTLPLPNASENLTPTTCYLPMMTSNLSLESPAIRRRVDGPSTLHSIQVPSNSHVDPGMYSPLTPDTKRRRYNYSATSNGRRPEGAYYHARRDSLPPINAMRPNTPSTVTMPPPRTPRESRRGSVDLNVLVPNQHDQSRSVEAMVMSVPYGVKVKVLGRITPPLKDPGPTSPAVQVRGAIIAIEGDNTPAVKELADWLKDFLLKEKEYSVRVAGPPDTPDADVKDNVAFEDYLDLIKEWHSKSREMIQFITTPVSSEANSDEEKDKEKGKDSPMSTSDFKIKPVVILPTYQLRAADVYTSRIPIQDAYSPTDHWQWMATLWRGTVGPDLTIYIKSIDTKDTSPGGKLVQLDEEVRCLTVKKEKGSKFEESALRRVGFEVGEWIRSIGVKSG